MISKLASNKVTNLSFICAVLIVGIHLNGAYVKGTGSWWMHEFFSLGVCSVALPFFFIVSGYFLAERMDGTGWWSNAIRKRLKSLIVPFYLWSSLFFLCVLGADIIANFYANKLLLEGVNYPPDFSRILRFLGVDLFAFPELGLLWYVRAIMLFVVISPCFKRFPLGSVIVLGVGVLSAGPFLQMNRMSPFVFFFRWGGFPLIGAFYFAVGILLSRTRVKVVITNQVAVACLILGLISFVVRSFLVYKGFSGFYIGMIGVPLVLIGLWGVLGEMKWPSFLVGNSFGIYLIHMFFMTAYWELDGRMAYCRSVILFVIIWTLVVVGSLCVANIIRRIPIASEYLLGGR